MSRRAISRRLRRVDVPLLGFFVMGSAVIVLLVVVAVLHVELLTLRAEVPVTAYQLETR